MEELDVTHGVVFRVLEPFGPGRELDAVEAGQAPDKARRTAAVSESLVVLTMGGRLDGHQDYS
jgi:hypothetical protein